MCSLWDRWALFACLLLGVVTQGAGKNNSTQLECSSLTTCTSCVSETFPCDWCVDGHRCTHNAAENCRNDILVTGVARFAQSHRTGPRFCPSINATSGDSTEILVASGVEKSIRVQVDIVFRFIMQTRFVCQFNIEGRETSVNAELIGDMLFCSAMEFAYTARAPRITAQLAVIWSGNKLLDNPRNIHVVIYRCRYLVDNCYSCLALAKDYDCGWCQSSGSCEIQSQCGQGKGVWLNRRHKCPDQKLGPEEGANTTAHGSNCGNPAATPTPAASAVGCPVLTSHSTRVRCSLAGGRTDCGRAPVPPGTTARLECREGYKPQGSHPGALNTTCSATGRWRPRPFVCLLDCGLRRFHGTPLSLGGEEAFKGEFPWHVAIFHENRNKYQPLCGGSLITMNFFVSAAHCFWDGTASKPQNASLFMVAVGKHTLLWTTTDKHEQRQTLKAIHIHERYSHQTLASDIALVQLTAPVEVTTAVNVVCMDWKSTFEHHQLINNSLGTVPGWGLTEDNTQSATLRFVDLPFVPFVECRDSVPQGFHGHLHSHKICGGFRNRSKGVCKGDSGGGFVFPSQTPLGPRYYLRGVVSASPTRWGASSVVCYAEHRSTFTVISAFAEWMERIVFSSTDDDY